MMDLREFYSVPEKVEVIGQFLLNSISSMEQEMTLRGGDEEE